MSEDVEVEPFNELSPNAAAFLEVLQRHLDTPISQADIIEESEGLDWVGKFSPSWKELENIPELHDRLVVLASNKTAAYALLGKDNDIDLLEKRTKFIDAYNKEHGTTEQYKKIWRKRNIALGALALALSGGVGIGAYYKRKGK